MEIAQMQKNCLKCESSYGVWYNKNVSETGIKSCYFYCFYCGSLMLLLLNRLFFIGWVGFLSSPFTMFLLEQLVTISLLLLLLNF